MCTHSESFSELLNCPRERIDSMPIEDLNIICSEGLMGEACISLAEVHRLLNEAAVGVRELTLSRTELFERERELFLNCEPIWRCYLLGAFLHRHFCITYCHEERDLSSDADWSRADRFFLFGLLSGEYHGTCASLPVLFVAVARRLRYPVYLVEFPTHCFVRWDESISPYREYIFHRNNSDPLCFNIEFNGEGIDVRTDQEIVARFHQDLSAMIRNMPYHRYMFSKTSAEELVHFLRLRAYAMESVGKYDEAKQAYEFAISLNPKDEVSLYEYREFSQLHREYSLGSIGVMAERGLMYRDQALRNQPLHRSADRRDFVLPSRLNPYRNQDFINHPTQLEWMFDPARYGLSRFRPMPLEVAERIFASVTSLRRYLLRLQPRKPVFRDQSERPSSDHASHLGVAEPK